MLKLYVGMSRENLHQINLNWQGHSSTEERAEPPYQSNSRWGKSGKVQLLGTSDKVLERSWPMRCMSTLIYSSICKHFSLCWDHQCCWSETRLPPFIRCHSLSWMITFQRNTSRFKRERHTWVIKLSKWL